MRITTGIDPVADATPAEHRHRVQSGAESRNPVQDPVDATRWDVGTINQHGPIISPDDRPVVLMRDLIQTPPMLSDHIAPNLR